MSAQGLLTSPRFADGINTARDKAFRSKHARTYEAQPDLYVGQAEMPRRSRAPGCAP